MRKHPKQLSDEGISAARYAELKNVCRQYQEYKREIRRIQAGIVNRLERSSGAWKRPDPTGNTAVYINDLTGWMAARVKAIEQSAARSAPHAVAGAVLRSVTEGLSYDVLCPPCGKRQFFAYRLLFYILLDVELKDLEKG